MSAPLPDHAQTVIVGGGIVGCSVAYHLTKLGRKNVVLLERSELTSGTTWHAAGLVTQLRNSHTLMEIAKYGVDFYPQLEVETGQPTGFEQTGSITVARTEGRMDELKKITSLARVFGIEIEPITIREAGEMWPLMRTDDLVGAIHIVKDGQTLDRKSTRLNSSHVVISYAVFCLKKKIQYLAIPGPILHVMSDT